MAIAMDAGLTDAERKILNLPSERDWDNWEPLGAVANLAGGDWPRLWREAASSLAGDLGEARGTEKALLDIWKACRELRREHYEKAREIPRNARAAGLSVRAGAKQGAQLFPGPLTWIKSDKLAQRLKGMPNSFVAHLELDQQIKSKVAQVLKGFGVQPERKRPKGSSELSRGYAMKGIRVAYRQYGGRG